LAAFEADAETAVAATDITVMNIMPVPTRNNATLFMDFISRTSLRLRRIIIAGNSCGYPPFQEVATNNQ
jgi:hypothetical protein